jgi:hypothetical protein
LNDATAPEYPGLDVISFSYDAFASISSECAITTLRPRRLAS